MVDVDDLTNQSPTLLSVWGVFLNIDKNNSMGIDYMPLYPVPGFPEDNAEIDNLFSLENRKSLSPQFLEYLGKTYRFPWDNYIVLDHRAVVILSDWITGIPADIQSAKPIGPEEEKNLVREQETLLLDICQSLTQENLQGRASLKWQKVIPAHFLTNQSERTLLDNWALIIKSTKPARCKILPGR